MNLIVIILLAVVAIVDFWLIFTRRPTISHRFQALFPSFFDLMLLVMAVLLVLYIPTISATLKVLVGVVLGHLFWPNKERFQ